MVANTSTVPTRSRALGVALAALLALSLVSMFAPGAGTVAAAADGDDCEPENTVTVDEFRHDNDTLSEFDTTGEVIVEKQNTNVSVDADEAFVRLSVANANSYCVELNIQMSEDVAEPATLGSITADDGNLNAEWRATHDFDADETYTDVTVTVPGGSEATFAPSQLRVHSLSWTSDLEATGFLDRVTDSVGFGSTPLETRTHTIGGNESERITIPLTHPENAEESIDDWRATYTVDGEDSTKILSQGSGEPVFYRSVDDGEAVEIVFNEPGEVEFIAEPTIRDRIGWQIDSYLSSLTDLIPVPGATGPLGSNPVALIGGVWP